MKTIYVTVIAKHIAVVPIPAPDDMSNMEKIDYAEKMVANMAPDKRLGSGSHKVKWEYFGDLTRPTL